jgi:hypothetical protein
MNSELHEVFADGVRDVGGRVLVLGSVRLRGIASGVEALDAVGLHE